MDTTLVINPGSSSKKYALFTGGREVLAVLFEHTKEGYGRCTEVNRSRKRCEDITEHVYEEALAEVLRIAEEEGVLGNGKRVSTVGVRIVAPGTYFAKHRLINDEYRSYLTALSPVAPLHIPHVLHELDTLARLLPSVPAVGVSDSAFHATMPEYARRYSIPVSDAEQHDVYRFGYHGISVASAVRKVREELGEIPKRMVVCHVGSGVSVTALKNGTSVDTTMGFSPVDGLIMGSRAGDLSVGALLYLMKAKGLTPEEAEAYVTKDGGFRGLLGQNDLRVVLDRMARGDASARVAVEMFTYHVKRAVGSLTAVLGGVDLVVLTATAAERNPTVRALVLGGLEHLGILIDWRENESLQGRSGTMSRVDSPVRVLVLHTEEMEEIFHTTNQVLAGR